MDASVGVHRELGPGLLESVYEQCLLHELTARGISTKTQVSVPVSYRGLHLEMGFRADLILDDALLIELKAVESLLPVHKAQIITYLKLTRLPLGLLINFNVPLLKDGLHRFIHPALLRNS
ncbi:MAG: GxxExxY protein [Opitutia bacterium]|nr:MAG: GxxExxY protein [Opitutae bacterium]